MSALYFNDWYTTTPIYGRFDRWSWHESQPPDQTNQRRLNMNLLDSKRILENRGVLVALPLGEHLYCFLDSNCPLAVKLRTIMGEAGVTMEELESSYVDLSPERIRVTAPEINSKVLISVMGKSLEVDVSDVVSNDIADRIKRRIRDLERVRDNLIQYSTDCYDMYKQEVLGVRETSILPQLSFPIGEILKYRALVTGDGGKEYCILLPLVYQPGFITTGGVRYEICGEHKASIRRLCWILFNMGENRFYRARLLVEGERGRLRGLPHYHGTGAEDCWGYIHMPDKWQGTLGELGALRDKLVVALGVVNGDSLMTPEPVSMPTYTELFESSTSLGVEGKIDPKVLSVDELAAEVDAAEQATEERPIRWGQRREHNDTERALPETATTTA